MNKSMLMLRGGAALAVAMFGCVSNTERFDPTDTTSDAAGVRSLLTVSASECFEAARAAAEDAMTSPAYTYFLEQYQRENNGRLPLMQVSGYLRNDTNDPDLNVAEITDVLTKALRDSGKVRITLATGRDARGTFADARDLKRDKNFNQDTVAREGTLNAPSLSLEGSIISNTVRDGSTSVKVTSFNLKIADIVTGEEIWSYNKPLGFKRSQSLFGL